jgi:hypothetical protein
MFLVGALREAGPFNYSFAVRDAGGNLSNEVQLSVTAPVEWVVETVALIDAFLTTGSDAVTAGEREYLDEIGNGNGQYDVGDLRKWLRTNGG